MVSHGEDPDDPGHLAQSVLPQNIGNPHGRPKGAKNATPVIEEQHRKNSPTSGKQ
jgi:hypothetical protein